jgi:glycosyltransferase involved in cell wall biosynthesis
MKPQFIVSCPIDTYSGYGARSRDVVKAIIEMDKYDVKILPQRWGATPWGFIKDHEEWEFLNKYLFYPEPNKQYPKPDIWMQITIPNEFMPQGHYSIGMTAGIETTLCRAEWIEGANRMNLVLGSSNHSIEVLKNSKFQQKDQKTQQVIKNIELNTKTEVLFEGFNENIWKKSNKYLDLPEIKESFCFLFVGHWMQGAFGHDRKNASLLVKSFLETFKNKPKQPALIMKTSGGMISYMDRDALLKKIDDIKKTVKGKLPKIYVIHGDLLDEEMNELYNHPRVKCMVNITKGEGFGRPLLEFTQTKKPIIATGWSGHVDFLKPDMSILLPGTLGDLHPSVRNDWFVEGAKWFDVDKMALGKALKDMYKNYKNWTHKAKQQGNFAKENFTYTKMKEKFSKILEENITAAPKQVSLQLPKLKKISGDNKSGLPKLKLPKLQKINNPPKPELPKLKLPKLHKI